MRFRRFMAVLVPVGAASALAIVPVGTSAMTPTRTAPTGHVTPEAGSPQAYRYVGREHSRAAGYQFTCQQPGASPNCYTPQELATAYDIPRNLTGAGQTIVLIDAFGDPTITQDLGVEDSTFKLPGAHLGIVYPNGKPAFNPANADEVNWSGETALDVESAHAVAPAAKIDLVIAKNDLDPAILSALRYAVSHRLGSVLSQSYGEAESCAASSVVRADHILFARAAAQGVTVFAASGDNGAAQPSCDGATYIRSASLPAADPLVTGVGATSLTAAQPAGTYRSETAWNDSYGSSGGGYSRLYRRPSYQNGFVRAGARGVPDISYSGDVNNGLLIAWSQGVAANVGNIYEFGGSSAAAPQWAAIIALADQLRHRRVGFLNDHIYSFAHGSRYGYAFHDITRGNNTVSVAGSSNKTVRIAGYAAGKGWDAVTGLGSPNVAHLLRYLNLFSTGGVRVRRARRSARSAGGRPARSCRAARARSRRRPGNRRPAAAGGGPPWPLPR
jgi:subtilase family serine protease